MAWASCSLGEHIVMGEDMVVALEEGVETSENCGEVERSRKILNTSDLERAHDPVLFLSRGKSVKKKTQRVTC